MSTIDVKIFVDRIESVEKRDSGFGGSDLEVQVENLDTDSILSDIGIDEVIDYFSDELVEKISSVKPDELLKEIGKDKAIKYFNIEEQE